jgi:uncharacterized protein
MSATSLGPIHPTMTDIVLRNADAADFDAIVAINAVEVRQTSAMDMLRLRDLDALAGHHRVATVDGEVAAFLIAMRDGCGYANANFEWFAARFARFLYVDRIVVGSGHRGLGLGTQLYDELFGHARAIGVGTIACEYNLVPPNEASRAFHQRFGFREVGRQWLDGGAKQVSLQAAQLA